MEEWCLRVQGICKTYGEKQALQPIDESFAEHSFTCIVGRSGCGKTFVWAGKARRRED